jgi:hypothetical protein
MPGSVTLVAKISVLVLFLDLLSRNILVAPGQVQAIRTQGAQQRGQFFGLLDRNAAFTHNIVREAVKFSIRAAHTTDNWSEAPSPPYFFPVFTWP